jgi:hypothetical protein
LKPERKDGGGVLLDTYYTTVLSGFNIGAINDLPVDTQLNNKAYVQQFIPERDTELLVAIIGFCSCISADFRGNNPPSRPDSPQKL